MENNIKPYQYTIETLSKIYKDNNFEEGLSSSEAQKRLFEFGANSLQEKKVSQWRIFIKQFNSMIIYILIAAALLTVFLGHYSDSAIIGIVVIVNALIGYFQENKASKALSKIKSMLSTKAAVYRDGMRTDISAENLVPGDVIFLEAGDIVPADVRIIDEDNLKVQEATLTGEADSIEKTSTPIINDTVILAEQYNMAFASTFVTGGSGMGVVMHTGANTEIGKISTEVNSVINRKTPLMKEIDGLGRGISIVIIIAAIAFFILGLSVGTYSIAVLSLAIVTMIVGSIPEGLPATTSVILAMGVNDMAKHKHTIVKSLPSVETLGSVDIIATDKTGTLTQNEMTVENIYIGDHVYHISGNGYTPKGTLTENGKEVAMTPELQLFLESGYEANDTVLLQENNIWTINGEPTDGSFLTLYHKIFPLENKPPYEELDFLPFDSEYRYMAKLVKSKNDRNIIFIKGSPDKLIPMAKADDINFNMEYWYGLVTNLSTEGKRVVAVGFIEVNSSVTEITHELLFEGIEFLGLASIIDPPREEVIDALVKMREAGVDVKMITGDHPLTAKTIGERLGLADNIHVITGREWDSLSAEEKKKAALNNQVFARTTPKNKLEIIEALQSDDKITAMTGDGVNDAPALKRADIGIAMGIEGTDVAKDSADMILTNDNFATMATAISEGRRIYDNIKKSILFLLPTSFAEGLIIAFTLLMNRDMPLQTSQLLWINMVSAITIQFAFIFEPAEDGIMSRPPRRSGTGLMNKQDIIQMGYVSVVLALISLFAYDFLINLGADKETASTMMVNIIIISKIFYLFNIRTSRFAFSKAFFTNPTAFVIIGIMMVMQLMLIYLPSMQSIFKTESLNIFEWSISIATGAVILIITEIDKLRKIAKFRSKELQQV